MCNRTAQRTHRKRYNVQRAPAHATVKQAVQRRAHCPRLHPVVGGPGIVLALAANERAIFDARHIVRVRPRKVAVRPLDGIKTPQRSGFYHLRTQAIVFGFASVTPLDAFRLGQRRDFADPRKQAKVADIGRRGN